MSTKVIATNDIAAGEAVVVWGGLARPAFEHEKGAVATALEAINKGELVELNAANRTIKRAKPR